MVRSGWLDGLRQFHRHGELAPITPSAIIPETLDSLSGALGRKEWVHPSSLGSRASVFGATKGILVMDMYLLCIGTSSFHTNNYTDFGSL